MSNEYLAKAQERVTPFASEHRMPWDGEDVEMVSVMGTEVPVEELALALGRTVYAVENVKQALREGTKVGGGRRRSEAAQTPSYTFLGDDVPPGWW